MPVDAIGYFIGRAKADDLRWQITYMLHGVDHPDAVEFVVGELAAMDRRLEGTKSFSPFSMSARDEWTRAQEMGGVAMSEASRQRLLDQWTDASNDRFLRKHAFLFWSATKMHGDLQIMRALPASDILADNVLWERIWRRDPDAMPLYIDKLRGEPRENWWQLGLQIGPALKLVDVIDEELTKRSAAVTRDWSATYKTDYVIAEILTQLPYEQAEALLLKHWDHVRFRSYFIHSALYTATPALTERVKGVLSECPQPKEMLKHLRIHYGIKTVGRAGIYRQEQLEALLPYMDHFSIHDLADLWEVCNDRGWFEFRRKHLDASVRESYDGVYVDEGRAFASLDDHVEKGHFHWVDLWIEKYRKSGASLDEVMALFARWLSVRRSLGALKMVAEALINAGERRHIAIMDVQDIEPPDEAEAIRADTSFAVKCRTLS